jgi:hypothetical protein
MARSRLYGLFGVNFCFWPEAADRGCPRIGRDQGQTGRFMLGMSLSARDPFPTLQTVSLSSSQQSRFWAVPKCKMKIFGL